jgi:hypothetical protein
MAGDSAALAIDAGETGYGFTIAGDTAAADYAKESAKENTQRPARVETRLLVTGTGQTRLGNAITFPCLFKDIPTLSVGSAVSKNPDVTNWYDPIGIAGVVAWIKDSTGLFTGARIWVRVDMHPVVDPIVGTFAPIPPNATQTMVYLTFSARATKRITDSGITDEMTPNSTPL